MKLWISRKAKRLASTWKDWVVNSTLMQSGKFPNVIINNRCLKIKRLNNATPKRVTEMKAKTTSILIDICISTSLFMVLSNSFGAVYAMMHLIATIRKLGFWWKWPFATPLTSGVTKCHQSTRRYFWTIFGRKTNNGFQSLHFYCDSTKLSCLDYYLGIN